MPTVPRLLARRAAKTPESPAFCFKRDAAAWEPICWQDFADRVGAIAAKLGELGLSRGDRIGILAPTSIEWEYVQMGALRLGAVVVGIDSGYPEETRHALLRSLHLTALAVQDAAALDLISADVRNALKGIIVFAGTAPASGRSALSIQHTLERGRAGAQARASLPEPSAHDVAIVVFSSGTSGTPKPIAYTHHQVVLAVEAIVEAFPDITEGSHLVCWLPLANLFQRIINFCAVANGAVSYIVSDPRNVMNELPSAAPALFIGVPRFYERVREGIENRIASMNGVAGLLGRLGLGLVRRRSEGAASMTDRLLAPLLEKWVLSRLRGTFGPNLRYLISGSAPMPKRLLRWYESIGLPVYEAYGVSENIVPIAMNRPGVRRSGTVGPPLRLNDVRLGDGGEILVRGPGVFSGYLDATEAISPRPDGFWPTGDLGAFDAEGFLTLTGRKSDVFKSPGGRWIVPGHVEATLQAVPWVGQAVVLGEGLPGIVALLHVDGAILRSRRSSPPAQAAPSSSGGFSQAERQFLLAELQSTLAALPRGERPQAVVVRTRPFTIEEGELTTNLKVRRQAIAQKHRAAIDRAIRELELARRSPGSQETALPLIVEVQ